jgi:phage-related baseplate assembly protein
VPSYTQIDLSGLPAPLAIEALDYETILAEMKNAVTLAMPGLAPVLEIETEPATKVIEVCAGFVLLTRQRVNDAAKAVLLAYATGSNLDHLGALFGVARLVITPADPEATPPVVAVLEADTPFRARIQLSMEGYTSAGPRGAYEFHARSASADVKDVLVAGPDTAGLTIAPGSVEVYVLAYPSDDAPQGVPGSDLLALVDDAVGADDVRPLCDQVSVLPASILEYTVEAELEIFAGPDPAAVLAQAQTALATYLASVHAIGAVVAVSGIMAALHRTGVARVVLTEPSADIVPDPNEAPFCTGSVVTYEVSGA